MYIYFLLPPKRIFVLHLFAFFYLHFLFHPFHFRCHLATFPISLVEAHFSLQWISLAPPHPRSSCLSSLTSLWFPHLLSSPSSFLLSPAVGGAAEDSWVPIGRAGRRLLWHRDAVQMLSSSGSRERQAGGILSLSLPISLPPPSFSSFLSLHAQARIHTRALRHTAAEGRGHTVKLWGRTRPILFLLIPPVKDNLSLSLLRYPLLSFEDHRTRGAPGKGLTAARRIYGSHTYILFFFFFSAFLVARQCWLSVRTCAQACVRMTRCFSPADWTFFSSLFPVCTWHPSHLRRLPLSFLLTKADRIPGCRAAGHSARPQQHGQSTGGVGQHGLDGSAPDGRAYALSRFRWVRTVRAPKSITASSETMSQKVCAHTCMNTPSSLTHTHTHTYSTVIWSWSPFWSPEYNLDLSSCAVKSSNSADSSDFGHLVPPHTPVIGLQHALVRLFSFNYWVL